MPQFDTDAWLLDSCVPGKLGGTGAQFNWDLAVEAKQLGRPIILAGGLTPGKCRSGRASRSAVRRGRLQRRRVRAR